MAQQRLFKGLVVVLGCCVLLWAAALSLAAPGYQGATPTPLPEVDLRALAAAVEQDNATRGNFTQWREGNLGEAQGAMPDIVYGQKMPGFALCDAAGAPVILDRIEGPKLVNFWATWCGPCVEEFPLLSAAARDENAPFDVVFVNVWDDVHAYTDFANQNPDLTMVRDSDDRVNIGLAVVAIPTSLLIDSDGVVRLLHVGNITPSVMDLLNAVAAGLE